MSSFDGAQIQRAAELIRAGKLVAFPTETVYGLGANALDAAAVRRIFEVKGRPATSPLIVHVASVQMAREQVVADWPAAAQVLAERYWPGPLTLVLPKRPAIPDEVTAGLPTVGVRIPSNPIALALIEAATVPVAAPSANRFTELSPTDAEHVRRTLGSQIEMVLDGGPATVGIESTVLSLAGPQPVLLRPGMVTQTELEAVLGPVLRATEPSAGPHASPGMHHRHYSPRTAVRLGGEPGARDAWVFYDHPSSAAGKQLRLPATPGGYAEALYRTLHQLDTERWDSICIEPVPDTREWDGIRDRLSRAGK